MVRGPLDVAFVEVEHDLGADHVALRAVAVPKQDVVDTFVRRLRGVGEVACAVGREDRPAVFSLEMVGESGRALKSPPRKTGFFEPPNSRSMTLLISSTCPA